MGVRGDGKEQVAADAVLRRLGFQIGVSPLAEDVEVVEVSEVFAGFRSDLFGIGVGVNVKYFEH